MSLIHHYPLIADANDAWADNDGTVSGNTTYVDGPLGRMSKFDGDADFVLSNTPWELENDFSFSVWFKRDAWSSSSSGGIMSTHWHTPTPTGVSITTRNQINVIAISTADGVNRPGRDITIPGADFTKLTHIVLTYKGDLMTLYHAGAEVASLTVPKIVHSSGTRGWCFGRWAASYGSYYFNGKIGDARVYDHALSAAEVRKLYLGAVVALDTNEDYSGDPITDTTNRGNDAIQTSPPTWTSDSEFGRGALSFNGNNTLTMPNPLKQPNLEQEWTVVANVFLTVNNRTQQLINFNNACNITHATTTRGLMYLNGGANDYYIYSNPPPAGEWFQIAFAFRNSDGTRRIYHNGVDQSAHGPNNTSTPVGMPATVTIGAGLIGKLSNIRIFARCLSVSEISQLYHTRASFDDYGNISANAIRELHSYDDSISASNLVHDTVSNFPGFSETAPGEYSYTSNSAMLISSQSIPIRGNGVDTFDRYRISCEAKAVDVASRMYFFIACYNKFGAFIAHAAVSFYAGRDAVLAQPLNDGDIWVYLDNVTNWTNSGNGTYINGMSFGIWPAGRDPVFEPLKYSQFDARYIEVDTTNKRLKLTTPWARGPQAVGTLVANSFSGGGYSYVGASYALLEVGVWNTYAGDTGTNDAWVTGIRYGTESIRIGWLLNRNATSPTTAIRNVKLWNLDYPQTEQFTIDKPSVQQSGQVVAYQLSEVGITKGLTHWWPLRDNLDVVDVDGGTLTEVGSPIHSSEGVYLDGTSRLNFRLISDPGDYRADNVTYSAWAKREESINPYDVFMGSGLPYIAITSSNAILFSLYIDSQQYTIQTTSNLVDFTKFNHIACTYDGFYMRIYLNGSESKSAAIVGRITADSSGWVIGAQNTSGQYPFKGTIRDAQIYERCLTPEEVNIHYNATHPDRTTAPVTVNESGYFIHGEFNEL